MVIFSLCISCVVLVAMVLVLRYTIKECKRENEMSFSQSMELVNMPIVTFYSGNAQLNMILDTGATHSMLCSSLKGHVEFEYYGKCNVIGVSNSIQENDSGILKMQYKGNDFETMCCFSDTIEASFKGIEEVKGITIHGLLGRSFFDTYGYLIDFNEYKFYNKHRK